MAARCLTRRLPHHRSLRSKSQPCSCFPEGQSGRAQRGAAAGVGGTTEIAMQRINNRGLVKLFDIESIYAFLLNGNNKNSRS